MTDTTIPSAATPGASGAATGTAMAPDTGVRPTCLTCPYWKRGFRSSATIPSGQWTTTRLSYAKAGFPETLEVNFGDCRRHAARPAPFDDGGSFGITCGDDWCGDHPDFLTWTALARATEQGGDDADRRGEGV